MPIARFLSRSAAALLIGIAPCLAVVLHAQRASAQSCFVNGAFNLNFGEVTSAGAVTSGSESVTCQPPFAAGQTNYYVVCIYMGLGGQPAATRRMTNYNGSYLNYDLFADAAHTRLIGPQPAGPPAAPVQFAASGSVAQTILVPIYGWVYPGQAVPPTGYYDNGMSGTMIYRFSTTGFPVTTDCTSGGTGGGGPITIGSSAIQATFANACMVSATDINFGAVPAPQAPLREDGDIQVICAPGTPFQVGLDNGQNFDGAMRRMAGPGGYVRYQLYLDEANTQVWGNDQASMATGTTDSSGNPASLTVYGQVPAQPDVGVGSYADTIVVTLYY